MNDISHQSQRADLKPRAVLAIGVSGHRKIGSEATPELAATLEKLFIGLRDALIVAAQTHAAYFSEAEPALRTVGMAAEGADLLCAQAAKAAGSSVVCVLPYPFDEYQNDFSSSGTAAVAKSVIESADIQFVLPGRREEGPRSYERANETILANVDVVIAVWDGDWTTARAGTAEVVQAAISRKIPVIVLSPSEPSVPKLLVAPGETELVRPVAADLPQRPLESNLNGLVNKLLSPPAGEYSRRGLIDLLEEMRYPRSLRFEYPLLLKLFGVGSDRSALIAEARRAVNDFESGLPADFPKIIDQVDQLASHYARLYRSSTISETGLTIVAAFLSALALIFFPSIAGTSVVVQMAINGLVLVDSMTRTRRRWQERWLDYRVVAERLRCVRFLHPLALGLHEPHLPFRRNDGSWVEWFVHRHERSLDPPRGAVEINDITNFARLLVDLEVPEQLKYHRLAFHQLGALDQRLSFAAKISLITTIAVAAVFGFSAYFDGGFDHVRWKPIAVACLLVLPTMATAFNAIRANADLIRLVERSAMMAVALKKLQIVVRSTAMNYDRAAVAATRFADIMGEELSEWRFVIESRRIRTDSRIKDHFAGLE